MSALKERGRCEPILNNQSLAVPVARADPRPFATARGPSSLVPQERSRAMPDPVPGAKCLKKPEPSKPSDRHQKEAEHVD